jgi:cell division protein ZapA
MDKIALKIIIAGRTYPLTIKKEEESAIRGAADRINSNIQKLQGSYAVKDMQDLLAMTALQIAVQNTTASENKTPSFDPTTFNEDLRKIIEKIDA